MDLSHVWWIGGSRPDVADELGSRFGIGVRTIGQDGIQAFRRLLEELRELEDEQLIVSGPFAPPAVAAVLRDSSHAVFVADAATARDAHVLRLATLSPDAPLDELVVAAAGLLGLSGAGGTSP